MLRSASNLLRMSVHMKRNVHLLPGRRADHGDDQRIALERELTTQLSSGAAGLRGYQHPIRKIRRSVQKTLDEAH